MTMKNPTAAPLLALLLSLTLLPACAPLPAGSVVPSRGVPGFDTRDYPGDATMRRWFSASPYRWVGYYLPAPCYTGTTWSGRRDALHSMGWGFAVLYVGEQDWVGIRGLPQDTARVAQEGARCTTANLTADNASRHAAEAESTAAADGFPTGTVIFLNVERVDRVSPALSAYVRAWAAALLERGRYTPGVYAHDHNAAELFTVLTEEFARRGRVERPRLWVAKAAGFDIQRSPVESGYPVATAWQGIFDVRESWDGVTLTIDVNVADSADPSRGR
jgi:hypothetical protein